jgi:hypothetical protein
MTIQLTDKLNSSSINNGFVENATVEERRNFELLIGLKEYKNKIDQIARKFDIENQSPENLKKLMKEVIDKIQIKAYIDSTNERLSCDCANAFATVYFETFVYLRAPRKELGRSLSCDIPRS